VDSAKGICISVNRTLLIDNFILVLFEFKSPSQKSGTGILNAEYPRKGAVISHYRELSTVQILPEILATPNDGKELFFHSRVVPFSGV
jgi:hypothetical protein